MTERDASTQAGRDTVVITGLGCVTALGDTVAATWEAILAGRGGVDSISRFDASDYPVRIAAEVRDFDVRSRVRSRDGRRADRVIQYAEAATWEALEHANLSLADIDAERVGVVIGTAMGGVETFEEGVRTLHTRGPKRVSPYFIAMMLPDMASGIVSIATGARGPNLATVSACASGAHAIGEAAEMIRRGVVDVVLAGGSEAAATPSGVAGFAAAGALSTRNDDPTSASRPFDADRDGFVLGEGAGMLVLESAAHAQARGATVLAVLSGYGTTADAYHLVQPGPGGEGAVRAIRLALAQAGLADDPSRISYVNAHGTSTRLNDATETQALHTVFGTPPPTSSTKGATGHLLGAAGAVEAVFSVLAIRDQVLPPTINHQTPDPACDLDVVPNSPRAANVQHVLSNSLGFGGHNVALIFSQA